jgi:protein-S-isoprenylcysteine O-methyltransferase Ste14
MKPTVALVFWTLFTLGPIPIWHLLLHAALPFWRRHPWIFYGASAVVWALFFPLSSELGSGSSALFSPVAGVKWICLAAGVAALLVSGWSIVTLTPRRFFLWATLRPEESPPVLIRRGPYRFAAHPTYLSMLVAAAASFLASGEAVLLGTFFAMSVLLTLVIVLEQRELRSRLSASASPLQAGGAAIVPARRSTPSPGMVR